MPVLRGIVDAGAVKSRRQRWLRGLSQAPAFAAIWTVVKADDAFRNYAHDEQCHREKALNLVRIG